MRLLAYLVWEHPRLCCAALFIAVMAGLKYGVLPYIVDHYGLAGTLLWCAAMFMIGCIIEGRDRRLGQRRD